MVKFIVTGTVRLNDVRTFKKEVDAKSENDAKDKVYALFGSNNRVKRNRVKIEKVEKQ